MTTRSPVVPQIAATVVTIRTTLQPQNKSFVHTVAIARDHARSSAELDQWRLLDLKNGSVTFVDDINRTYRVVPLSSLLAAREGTMSRPLREDIPLAQFSTTTATRDLLGVAATQSVIRSGAYTRELWMARHPAIPPQLFSMMMASDAPSSQLAPMMRDVDAALLKLQGFPLDDHAELPYLDKKLVVDRTVIKVETKNVAESFLTIPTTYQDVSAPAAKKPVPRSSGPLAK